MTLHSTLELIAVSAFISGWLTYGVVVIRNSFLRDLRQLGISDLGGYQ